MLSQIKKNITQHGLALKSNVFLLVILLGLALLATKLYYHQGFPYTHDGENHLARFANYKVAIKEGQIPPRFAPNLMNHYGYPVFNYNYPLANIASVPFSFLKLPYQLTFKVLAASAVVFGLLGTWWWLTKLKSNTFSAVGLSLAAAATSPFLLSLLYFRGNIGELFAWSLLPWLFGHLTSPLLIKNKWLIGLWILIWTSFFLSHNVTVLYGTGFLLIYLFGQWPVFEVLKQRFTIFMVGLLASLWFWLPALLEKSAIILDNADLSIGFATHFPTIEQLLTGQQQFGFSTAGSIDSMSFTLGLGLVVAWAIAMITEIKTSISSLRREGTEKSKPALFIMGKLSPTQLIILIGLISFIFQLVVTQPFWQVIPFIRFIQFPWRLGMLFTLCASVLVGVVASRSSRFVVVLLALLVGAQIIVMSRTKPVDYFSKTNLDYDLFAQSTTTANENLPKAFTYESFSASWQPAPNVTPDSGNVIVDSWTGSRRLYQLTSTEEMLVIEPTMAFPGWRSEVLNTDSGEKTVAEYQDDQEIAGRLAFRLPAGNYQVTTTFTQQTPARLLGNSISLLTLACLFAWLLLPKSLASGLTSKLQKSKLNILTHLAKSSH